MPAITNLENVLHRSKANGFLSFNIEDVSANLTERRQRGTSFTALDAEMDPDTGGPNTWSIQTDQNVDVEFEWTQKGTFANMDVPIEFECQVLMELIGPGEKNDVPQEIVKFKKGNPHTYTKKVQIPAGSIDPGLYRVYATFKVRTTNDASLPPDERNQTPVAGFVDLGTINYYEAK
ncbi:MAG: hypothetical protein J5I98_15940 [Phaeodactylibacter sp.]|nr:hypothetical protein [Phaeodactylibacter sp.]